MLTLFVMQGVPGGNADKCISSMPDVVKNAIIVKKVDAINKCNTQQEKSWVEQPWFMVLYDNEYIDIYLKEALPEVLKDLKNAGDRQVFSLMKKSNDGKVSQSPRIYRNGTILQRDSLMPANISEKRFCRVLNGLILEI